MLQKNILNPAFIILLLTIATAYGNSIFLRRSSNNDVPSPHLNAQQMLDHWHPRQLLRSQLLLSRTRRMVSDDAKDTASSMLSDILNTNATMSESLRTILSNRSLTKRQLATKLKQWASGQSPTFNDLFQKYLQKVMSWSKEFRMKIAEASLSPEAKEALVEIAKNSENMDQTYDQQTVKNALILERQPGKIQFEIYQFYLQY